MENQDKWLRPLKYAVIVMGVILITGMAFVGSYAVNGLLSYFPEYKEKQTYASPEKTR